MPSPCLCRSLLAFIGQIELIWQNWQFSIIMIFTIVNHYNHYNCQMSRSSLPYIPKWKRVQDNLLVSRSNKRVSLWQDLGIQCPGLPTWRRGREVLLVEAPITILEKVVLLVDVCEAQPIILSGRLQNWRLMICSTRYCSGFADPCNS